MGCHPIYSVCYESGFMKVCECDKEKTSIINLLATTLRHIHEKNEEYINKHYREYPTQLCMYKSSVIKELEKIAECFEEYQNHSNDSSYLKKHCPSHIICNENYIAKLYTKNGHTLRNPDILIVKGRIVTVIIEEKSYGKQSYREFTEQITASYQYLPSELKTSCTFMVYAPRGGGTLPKGYVKHPKLLILGVEAGKGRFLAYCIPVIVLEQNILQYLLRAKSSTKSKF